MTSKTIVSKDVIEQLLDVEKLKYCYECGICTGSCPMVEILGNNYNPRSLLQSILSDPDNVLSSEELWLCAWCYRCYKRCNQAIETAGDIPFHAENRLCFRFGPPLLLKRDNGSNINHLAVNEGLLDFSFCL